MLNSASESVFYSLAYSVTGSSASESTLELKVLTDAPSASITGGFSALDGFSVNSFQFRFCWHSVYFIQLLPQQHQRILQFLNIT